MDLDNLSTAAQVEVNSLFGTEPAQESEIESAAVEEVEDLEVNSPDESADEPNYGEDDSETEETQAPESDIEYIKAAGKKVKIDFSDRENIKRVYSLAAGARQWQAERDALKIENVELVKTHGELKKTMDYLESIKDDHAELFEAVSGMSLQDKFEKWAEEQNLMGDMSEAEKSMYVSNQDHQKRIKAVEKREASLQKQLEEVGKRDETAKIAQQSSIANPIFFEYNFDGELGNTQLESRLNQTLWTSVKSELAEFDQATPDMFKEAFKRISNQIRAGFKLSSDKLVKKAVKQKRKIVKEKAQKLAVAEPRNNRAKELQDKLRSGDIAGILSGEFDLSNY